MRFDALAEMRSKYYKDLYELTWANITTRPDLQLRLTVLKMRDNYNVFKSTVEPFAFADAAYNGGIGGVNKERRACKISISCDPNKWFGNVENYCMKSKRPLYGGRSACQINREHVHDVLNARSNKYKKFWGV